MKSVQVNDELHLKVKIDAAKQDKSISQVANEIIESHYKNKSK